MIACDVGGRPAYVNFESFLKLRGCLRELEHEGKLGVERRAAEVEEGCAGKVKTIAGGLERYMKATALLEAVALGRCAAVCLKSAAMECR